MIETVILEHFRRFFIENRQFWIQNTRFQEQIVHFLDKIDWYGVKNGHVRSKITDLKSVEVQIRSKI